MNRASLSRCRPIRITPFHFTIRSLRVNDPTFSCPALVATARWLMNASAVSPERAETMGCHPACCVRRIASMVSVTVPIWLSLMSTELATPRVMPSRMRRMFVVNRSSSQRSDRAADRCARTRARIRPHPQRRSACFARIRSPAAWYTLMRDLHHLVKARCADRNEQTVLHVGAPVGMGATANDLNLWNRQQV